MRAVLPFMILLGVVACSRKPADPAPESKKSPAVTAPVPTFAEDSVAAVPLSSGRPSISLRFALVERPTVGKATPVRVDVSGDPGMLSLRFQAEGMGLDPAVAALTLADDGKPASQSVAVKPRSPGIGEIVVRIQPSGDDAQEVVYAIPLLVEAAAAR